MYLTNKKHNELILNNLNEKNEKVYYFENTDYDKDAPPHNHIAIKSKDNQYIIFAVIVSEKINKIKFCQKNNIDLNTLIHIDDSDVSILEKKSIIDCNYPIVGTIEEICAKIKGKITIKDANIDNSLINKIKNAINLSRLVKKYIKDLL